MPTITVEGPPIKELDRKRRLVKEMAEVASDVYGLPKQIIVVVIKENPPENVGVGGELLIDRRRKK